MEETMTDKSHSYPGMRKPAPTGAGVHELIRERWSPRALSDAPIAAGDLESLLEAAQWAPSSMNEQPWRFVVADRCANPEMHARVVSTLAPANVVWAQRAPILIVAVAHMTYSRNGAPNRHAFYDTGAAAVQLALQATSLGLGVHQMGGFSPDQARTTLGIPEGFEPVVVLAVGHPGDVAELSEELRARELAPRQRRPLRESVYSGAWDEPWTSGGNR
jgi:nitroreductase